MKTCPDCNTENKSEAKFCKQCRHAFEIDMPVVEVVECPQCHATNAANKKFCGVCGFNLREEAAQPKVSIEAPADIVLDPTPLTVSVPDPVQLPKATIKAVKPQPPRIDKTLIVKACYSRIQTALHSKLAHIVQLVKRKPKQQQESFEAESERSKIKRILVVACVAGATAVAASFGISWLMNDVAPTEAAQVAEAPVTQVQSPPEVAPQPVPTPPVPEVTSPTPIAATPTTPSANERIVSNNTTTTPVDQISNSTAQPAKKKQTSVQQDLNRQRLLELKRQLGQ